MKKYLIKSFFIIVLFTLLNAICFYTYAANTIDLDIMDENFTDQFSPVAKETNLSQTVSEPFLNVIKPIINKILGLLQWVGIILTVLSMTYYGINILLAQTPFANDLGLVGILDDGKTGKATKKDLQDYARHVLIGSIFLLSSTTIVKVVFVMLLE